MWRLSKKSLEYPHVVFEALIQCLVMIDVSPFFNLPVAEVLEALKRSFGSSHAVVLEAPPGAGKTTLVPLALLDEPWLEGQKILLLEPRRLAARGAAERMASMLGEQVGGTVGYRIRMESKVGPATRIEVVTEGILTRMLQDDPVLDGVGLVIFDEFHERHLDGDLGLTLCLYSRDELADLRTLPLKLLVMSATLGTDAVSAFLSHASVVKSEGRSYPIDIRYTAPFQYGENVVDRVAATVIDVLQQEMGSVLVFLPGQGEIRTAAQQLADLIDDTDVVITPLYGDLTLAEQRKAIAPVAEPQRKVVLATSIAESSLTIEGVRVVVDAGLSRVPVFDASTGMTQLQTQRVSRAAATQRAGRAGRMGPGICYRLWSESQQASLAEESPVEMAAADLTPLALQLMQWGVQHPNELRWLTAPSEHGFVQALQLLEGLGAIERESVNAQWRLTTHGQHMAGLPMHPRLGHMLLQALYWQAAGAVVATDSVALIEIAGALASLMAERDLFIRRASDAHALPVDMCLRLHCLLNIEGSGSAMGYKPSGGQLKRLRTQAKGFLRRLPALSAMQNRPCPALPVLSLDEWVAVLVAQAYPDRIAIKTKRGSYQLSNGRRCQLPEGDGLAKEKVLAVAQLYSHQRSGQGQLDNVGLAAALPVARFNDLLAACIEEQVILDWSDKDERLIAERQRSVGKALLDAQPLQCISAEEKQTAIAGMLKRKGFDALPWTDACLQFLHRVHHASRIAADENCASRLPQVEEIKRWPSFSKDGLMQNVDWLMPFLTDVSRQSDLEKVDLLSALKSRIEWSGQQWLNEHFPVSITVPSGRDVILDYSKDVPVLAVKLQEMFGCIETPAVANGLLPLQVHLLSPAGRPLQVTQDLAGFWQGAYHAVKKDMKGRYPKHPWPDDPLNFKATALTKNRLAKHQS